MRNNKVSIVDMLPKCDYCKEDARFDAKTLTGFWANMCFYHWKKYAASGELGLGIGQNLISKDEI